MAQNAENTNPTRPIFSADPQSEEALRQSEVRQRLIIESARDYAIFTVDLQRQVNSWNAGAEAMFGYTEEEIMGQPGDVVFVPEDRQQGVPQQEAQTAISEGRAENERWHIRKDGSRFFGSGVTTPWRNQAGAIIGVVKVMRDLTRQKKAEDDLKEADRRKDEFLALLAHELRNPMGTLSNTLLILQQTGGQDESMPLRMALDVMTREVRQLVRLVDDLLDVSRINQGKIALRLEQLDLNELVSQAVEACRPLMELEGRQLQVRVPDEPLLLDGDAARLTQVIRNLLANATKFTLEGGHVALVLEQTGGQALLRVVDDGIGIPVDQLQRIFEMFVQVDASRTRLQGGLGLGLTLVKEFVELHGGRVEAHSAGLNLGSEFIVWLPLKTSNESSK